MLEILFEKLLHMSMLGCYSVLIVCLVRLLLTKLGCDRKYICWLWAAVFLNLCLPVSLSGAFSLIPQPVAEFSSGENLQESEAVPEEPAKVQVLSPAGNPEDAGPSAGAEDEERNLGGLPQRPGKESADSFWKRARMAVQSEGFQRAGGAVWLLGVFSLLFYNGRLLWRLKKQIGKNRTGKRPEILELSGLDTPFVWGMVHPVICLPADMEKEERKYVLAHEQSHLNRKDPVLRPLAFGITVCHWFNPLAWLAYSLYCQDTEIACDEDVLRRSGRNIKKAYASSLLKYAARQNGFLLSPLTFGEPPVKRRIQHVLRYRKKGTLLSALAVVCVGLVAAGLLLRPDREGTSPAEPADPKTEESSAPKKEEERLVENNGGEVLGVHGTLYYMDGQKLYSDGRKLYTSSAGEDGSWAVYIHELDGSGFQKYADGQIVGWADGLGALVRKAEPDKAVGTPGEPGLYLLKEQELTVLYQGQEFFLGNDGAYAYFYENTEEGILLNRVRLEDGAEEKNILKEALPVKEITAFSPEDDYLLFAAGAVEGSGGYFQGDFYSYNQMPGRLFQEHLTDASDFWAADGYLYYQKYSDQGGEPGGLYRASYDLTGEEPVGEGLTFLAFEEDAGTILAAKQGNTEGVPNLVRILPDGSREELLLDMEQLLREGPEAGGAGLGWKLESGDKIRFSSVNVLKDKIYVRAEQWGWREGASVGWRDSLLVSAYVQAASDGSGFQLWDPKELKEQEEFDLSEETPGLPCEPEAGGWALDAALDVRREFAQLSWTPEPGAEEQTYLLGQEGRYTLYGSGDFQRMLLSDGTLYAEIQYPYAPSRGLLPELLEADFDGDGEMELAISLNVKYGTGVSIDTLLIGDPSPEGELYVHQFPEEEIMEQLSGALSWEEGEEGLKALVEGEPAGPPMKPEEGGEAYGSAFVGSQLRFDYEGNRIFAGAALCFQTKDQSLLVPEHNGWELRAELSYEDGGQFKLKGFESRLTENGI